MQDNIRKFVDLYNEIYDELYEKDDNVEGFMLAVQLYDAIASQYRDFLQAFNRYRDDFIASDREAASFVYALAVFQNTK